MGRDQIKCKRCAQQPAELDQEICLRCRDDEQATLPPTPNHTDDATIVPGQHQYDAPNAKRIGDYELIEEIARGGMGVVYKANHRNLNRVSAVKMILGGQFSSEEERQRFRIKAESAARLDHPAIVPIYEIGDHDGRAFFAMKYVDGGSLAERATSFAKDPKSAAQLMIAVAEGVHHAHQRGVLHRDLKPANILLDKEGQPYVTDLGLAKSTTGGSDLTHTGAVLGTPAYMPPEQAAGKSVTTAADVYSLGAILYELLVGQPAYRGETTVNVVMQVIDGPPEPPQKVNPDVDRDLELICLKAMAREPDERYSSAQAMADDLQSWLTGDAISVRAPSFQSRIASWMKKNQSLAYGIFAVVFGVLVCSPIAISFFSNSVGEIYDQFPDTDRPWLYRVSVPKFLSFLFSMLLFLIIWPSIGLLNATISNPPTFTRSITAGIRISAILSLIFYVLVGWLIVIQGVNNYSNSSLETVVEAVWPGDESTPAEAKEKANELFGGLDHIPESERASVVAKRFKADRYASFSFSLGVALLVVLVFAGPIVYGTMIAASLRRRKLRNWLFLIRYLIAWTSVSGLLLITFLTVMSRLSNGVVLKSHPAGIVVGVVILIAASYLSLRRWKKSPQVNVA
ncbi:serine/threonine-protein kinase [Mariniblastus fucicola]|uniref:non-specific serine/threonine protein kinase n=1 Tax=Mariniblastus fucicola TaxID=980251 RepID=A0A5B9P9C0_9BACT|nr:serine/threonine-protein kinase [Mariniblastus fucicola]QEG21532.1 Serine/threonine-protein kinase PrkC [Mariniblastus fucicola]